MKYNHRSFIWDIDAYKLGHMCQYPQDTDYVYSVLQLRSDKNFKQVPIVGLQYLIKEYLMQPILEGDVKELIEESKLMGIYHPETETKLMALVELYVAHAILPFGVESLKSKIDKIVALDTCFPVGTYFDGFLEVRSSINAFF